jgi:hypothetical protein
MRIAVAEYVETSEKHVLGDVVLRSEPVAVEGRKRVSGADDMERGRFSLVFYP